MDCKGQEIPLVELAASSSNDFIVNGKVTGEIPNVVIHYFEQMVDFKSNVSHRTYNQFRLLEDFWEVIKNSDGMPPIN